MSTKVTLPRDVAEALEELRTEYDTPALMRIAFRTGDIPVTDRAAAVNVYARANPEAFISALVNGYDVEKTADELAEEARQAARRHIYEVYAHRRSRIGMSDSERSKGFADGIRFTLRELGVTIPGINEEVSA